MITIGDRIKKMRLERAWKQQDMANKLNMSIPAYSNIETNFVEISMSRLNEIATIFEVDVMFFIYSGKPDPHKDSTVEINILKNKIAAYDIEIANLQKKLILLYEEAVNIKRAKNLLSPSDIPAVYIE